MVKKSKYIRSKKVKYLLVNVMERKVKKYWGQKNVKTYFVQKYGKKQLKLPYL